MTTAEQTMSKQPPRSCDPASLVTRTGVKLERDEKRVLARLFVSGGEARITATVLRILSFTPARVAEELAAVRRDFGHRHKDVDRILLGHFRAISGYVPSGATLTEDQKLLLGAFFTMEYSLESVALFNPSIVLHPDQSGIANGDVRFVMSLRACGEGHISSIAFRSGVLRAGSGMTVDPVTPYTLSEQPVEDKQYEKHPFSLKLNEMGGCDDNTQAILDRLDDLFTLKQLQQVIDLLNAERGDDPHFSEQADKVAWLAHSNYSLDFPTDSELSERVIFPVTANESRGIEDVRLVRFAYDDGRVTYYATYTAYNGFAILPQFIETDDFRHFKIVTLNGKCVQNKGMALFPRKISGEYQMLSRIDGEHLYLMRSDNRHFWNEAERLTWPRQNWEMVQIGNCGSPIETDEGWLVITHGVGAMRRYCIGAVLLDLDEPSRVISALTKPLLVPNESEREGYVPNVVYSCGAMVHQDQLILPYAVSDTWSTVATVPLPDLLDEMKRHRVR